MKNRYSQIQFLAANYSRLQGLRAIPLGMMVVFVSVWATYNQGPSANFTSLILATIGTVLLDRLTERYYKNVFGHVKPLPIRRREIIASVIVGVLAILAFGLDTAHLLRISMLGLVFSACFLEFLWRVDKSEWGQISVYFSENFIAAGLIAVVSILPLFGIFVWEVIGIKWQVVGIFIIFGIAITITGIIGHIRMVRALSTVDTKPNDIAAV